MSKFPDSEQRLWNEMMAFIEHLRETFGEDFKLGDIVLVADVLEPGNPIAVHGSDPRFWVQQALLEEGAHTAQEANEARSGVAEDD